MILYVLDMSTALTMHVVNDYGHVARIEIRRCPFRVTQERHCLHYRTKQSNKGI